MIDLSGQLVAVRAFQTALVGTFHFNILADGMLGPTTIAAINAVNDPDLLMEAATCAQLGWMQSLPSFPTFGKIWTERLRDFLPMTLRDTCSGSLKMNAWLQ